MKQIYLIALILIPLLLVGTVYGATPAQTGSTSDSATLNGPAGVLVSLSFEKTLPLAQALQFYNIVAILGLFAVAAMATFFDTELFAFILVGFAGFFMFIGWLQPPNPTLEYSILIGLGFLAVALYMKARLRETWGLGGPGTMLLNVVVYIIVLQATVSLVNNAGIFSTNTGTGGNDFAGISTLSQQTVVGQASGGGALTTLISISSLVGTLLVAAIVGLLSILEGVFLFYFVMVAAFPLLLGSSFALSIILLFNIGWDILLIKIIYDIFYTKNVFIDI
jgi:hypothetical protein